MIPVTAFTGEVVEEALKIMQEWVEVLKVAIKAECPSWEIVQAFQCPSLTETGKAIESADAKGTLHVDDLDENAMDALPWYSKCIKNWEEPVKCEPADIRRQIQVCKPFAEKLMQIRKMEAREAWGLAVLSKLQNHHKS